MTGALAEWVGRVVVLLVAAAVVELALPAGTLRRYVEVVVGLVVLVTVLRPVLGWLGTDLGLAAAEAQARLEQELAAAAPPPVIGTPSGFHDRVQEVFAAQVARAVREGLAQAFGVEARVDVELGGFPGDGTAPPGGAPALERVVVRLMPPEDDLAPAERPDPGRGEVVVEVPAVHVGAPAGAEGAVAVAGGSAPLADRVRHWVAAALGIEADRVTVEFTEEVVR